MKMKVSGYILLLFCVSISAQEFSAAGSIVTETAGGLPEWESPPEDIRSGAGVTGSLAFEYYPSERIRARAELIYEYRTGYLHPLGRYEASSLPAAVDQDAVPGMDFRQDLSVAQIWAEYSSENLFIKGGKVPVSWGTCWLMNPTDLTGSGDALEAFGSDVVYGVPGLSAEYLLNWNIGFDGYLLFQDSTGTGTVEIDDGNPVNYPWGLKARFYAGSADISLGGAKEVAKVSGKWVRRYYALADTAVEAGNALVNAEAAVALPFNEAGTGIHDDWNPSDSIFAGLSVSYWFEALETDLLAEYYYFGDGRDPGEYDASLILSGEKTLLGRGYTLLRASRDIGDELVISVSGLVNTADAGGLGIIETEWMPSPDSNLNITFMLPWGDGDSEFGGRRELGPVVPKWRVWDSVLCSCTYSLYF